MNTFKKIAIGLTMVTVMSGSSMAGQVICGGSVPLINSIVGIGVTALDFSAPGTSVEIAEFVINNNSSGFVITWSFQNGGFFALGGTSATADSTVPMTKIAFVQGGTAAWGTATTAPTLPTATSAAGTLGTPYVPTITSVGQTTPTINEKVVIQGDWLAADATTAMAGLYTETITFSIAATL
jgi:hypothetical protein